MMFVCIFYEVLILNHSLKNVFGIGILHILLVQAYIQYFKLYAYIKWTFLIFICVCIFLFYVSYYFEILKKEK